MLRVVYVNVKQMNGKLSTRSSVTSPYEDKYVDVKFVDKIAGYVTVTVDKEFQRWHLFCLAFGFVLLLLAPVVSSWVPFYYSNSMAVGVFLVIIILLFQVSIFVLLGIVVAGAALGYRMVRKFVIAEDGSVDVGIAQFVKWAMRVIAATFIFRVAVVFMLINSVIMLHLHISGPKGNQCAICFAFLQFLPTLRIVLFLNFLFLFSVRVLLILLWQWGHWLLVCQSAFLSLSSSGVVQILPLLLGIQFILQMGILGGVEDEQM